MCLGGRIDALIMTLGFEPGPLVSSLAAHASEGFRPGAEVIVLTPSFKDERAERAWRKLQDIFSMMELAKSNIGLKRVIVSLEDFTEAVLQIKQLFAGLRNKSVRISLAGGMRALILATFIAYLLTDWVEVPEVEVYLEGRGMALRLPKLAAALGPKLDKRKLAILTVMRPGIVYRLGDLCGFLSRDRSTIYRHLKDLLEVGLVEREDSGFKITNLGLLLKDLV